jgi:hypothetical protein
MEEALAKVGLKLERFIGPDTEHKYEPETKRKVDARVDELTKRGKDPVPQRVRFTTYTLRYDSMQWVTVTGLERHWRKATVDAEVAGGAAVTVKTSNVSALYLKFPLKNGPFAPDKVVTVTVDGQKVVFPADAALVGMFGLRKTDGKWAPSSADPGPRKRHGLQGPIDDAFMDGFVFVRPAGPGLHERRPAGRPASATGRSTSGGGCSAARPG